MFVNLRIDFHIMKWTFQCKEMNRKRCGCFGFQYQLKYIEKRQNWKYFGIVAYLEIFINFSHTKKIRIELSHLIVLNLE